MGIPREIERKFLVTGGGVPRVGKARHIVQGYVSSNGVATVRVRVCDGRAKLSIKDRGSPPGQGRAEFEYDIPLDHALYLLRQVCPLPPVEKLRYMITFGGHEWSVDEFLGENRGLVLAEIELDSRDAPFLAPHWVGEDVTSDPRYHNSFLYRNPYREWCDGPAPDPARWTSSEAAA